MPSGGAPLLPDSGGGPALGRLLESVTGGALAGASRATSRSGGLTELSGTCTISREGGAVSPLSPSDAWVSAEMAAFTARVKQIS